MTTQPYLRRSPCRGFSLVELLVAVGILALLAGLAFPAFSNAMHKSVVTEDLSNLRQLYQASHLFAIENRVYPGNSDVSGTDSTSVSGMTINVTNNRWYKQLAPYLELPDSGSRYWESPNNILMSPLASKSLGETSPDYPTHYQQASSTSYARLGATPSLSTRILYATGKSNAFHFWHGNMESRVGTFNNGRVNVVYLDGSTDSLPLDDITREMVDGP